MIKQNRLIGAALQSVCLAFEQVATLVAYSFLYSHHVPPKKVDRRFFTRRTRVLILSHLTHFCSNQSKFQTPLNPNTVP